MSSDLGMIIPGDVDFNLVDDMQHHAFEIDVGPRLSTVTLSDILELGSENTTLFGDGFNNGK